MGFNETLPTGRLPDTDVEGMRMFLSMLFTPKPHSNFFTQFYAGLVIVCVWSALAMATLIRRLRSQSAWLIQFYHTPRGTFVIPHAVMTLVIFLVLFTIAFIPYDLLTIAFYRGNERWQESYHFWRQSPWFLLWVAAFLSTAGTISAFPDALRQRGKEIGTLQRWLLRPGFFHSVLIICPVLCFVTLLTPIIICVKHFNRLLPRYHAWQANAADPSANVADLAMEARSLWLGITKVYYYDGIVFSLWFAWSIILFVFFVTVAVHTLWRVHAQVKLVNKKQKALARTQPTFYLFSSRPNYGRSHELDDGDEIAPSISDGKGVLDPASRLKNKNAAKKNINLDSKAKQWNAKRGKDLSPELGSCVQSPSSHLESPA